MASSGHILKHSARVTTQVQDLDGTRTVDVTVHLELDLDSLARQLTAAALVSDSKPKTASRVQEAVRLTILEEVTTVL